MYWQFYNHKTSVTAEVLATQALRRAKKLSRSGEKLFATPALDYFLKNPKSPDWAERLEYFTKLDDSDIWTCLKQWQHHDDKILAYISSALVNRKLPVSKIFGKKNSKQKIQELTEQAKTIVGVDDGSYFVHQTRIRVAPYDSKHSPIYIMNKDKTLDEISDSPLQILSHHLLNPIEKYHLCYLNVKKKA
jgi:HD superfamily phosphohydrolase